MLKRYILDTSVILHDSTSPFKFDDNIVIVPAIVIEELDSKKREEAEIGKNARDFLKKLDKLREDYPGQSTKGFDLETGGKLIIEMNHVSFEKLKDTFVERTNDNRILAVAKNYQEEDKNIPVIVVSNDAALRVKADALGLLAEKYESDRLIRKVDEIYSGYQEIYVERDFIDSFYKNGYIPLNALSNFVNLENIYVNEFIIMKDVYGGSSSAFGRVMLRSGNLVLQKPILGDFENPIYGIKPRNIHQKMLFELLMDPNVDLVTAFGKAGTGKTLLALASGLMQTQDLKTYTKVLAARPIAPVGKDIGFLPGEKDDKLRPWMQPIYDNLEFIFNTKGNTQALAAILAGMSNTLEIEAVTYMRGRSIPYRFIIIDEAQNLTPHEIKTIITRTGEKSKIVLLGDPDQIDHPYLDSVNNGLVYVTEKMKHLDNVGVVELLSKSERSLLSEQAANLL